jgi:Family of unknown function (DUF5995)
MATNLDTAIARRDVRVSDKKPLPRIEQVHSIDDVVRNLDRIIDWATAEQSTIGYFAVLYKRSTLAIRDAIDRDLFQDSTLMAEFDVIFAQRYFDALNGYFYPDEFPKLNVAWEVAFVSHNNPETTMLQQMVAAMNAHICFDLGVAAATVAPNRLREFEPDFDRITDLLVTQVRGLMVVFERLSPGFRWVRWTLPELWVIDRVLNKFRRGAWLFAIDMALHPDRVREKRVDHMSWTAALGAWYLHPPGRPWTPFRALVWVLGRGESRDVTGNLQALNRVAGRPADVRSAFR